MHRSGGGRGCGGLIAGRGGSSEAGRDSGAVDTVAGAAVPTLRERHLAASARRYLDDGECSGSATSRRHPRKR